MEPEHCRNELNALVCDFVERLCLKAQGPRDVKGERETEREQGLYCNFVYYAARAADILTQSWSQKLLQFLESLISTCSKVWPSIAGMCIYIYIRSVYIYNHCVYIYIYTVYTHTIYTV